MNRVTVVVRPQLVHQIPLRWFATGRTNFADNGGKQNSTPGWEGRKGDDHVLNRDGNDTQSSASLQARKDREQAKEGSGAISQKDERNSNQRAKDDHPEAPGPVIGMNSERGSKGH